MARVPSRLTVNYSTQSLRDLGEIWDWNADEYGVQRADNYVSFLRRETLKLANSTNPGREVDSADHFRYHVITRRSRGYGHVVVFVIEAENLFVLRYFHTSQDWETKFDQR